MQDRLRKKLREQIGFIDRSCRAFDDGHRSEAIRIALAARVLLHDTNRSTSLLMQLGARSRVRLLSTAARLPPELRGSRPALDIGGLAHFRIGAGRAELFAPLDRMPTEELPVDEWWNETAWSSGNARHSRAEIVLAAANQDGGAHVDPRLSPSYEKISRAGHAGFFGSNEEGGVSLHINASGESPEKPQGEPVVDAHLIVLRQMGFELVNSRDLYSLLV